MGARILRRDKCHHSLDVSSQTAVHAHYITIICKLRGLEAKPKMDLESCHSFNLLARTKSRDMLEARLGKPNNLWQKILSHQHGPKEQTGYNKDY